jgi:hypothetical protein
MENHRFIRHDDRHGRVGFRLPYYRGSHANADRRLSISVIDIDP